MPHRPGICQVGRLSLSPSRAPAAAADQAPATAPTDCSQQCCIVDRLAVDVAEPDRFVVLFTREVFASRRINVLLQVVFSGAFERMSI